MSPQSAENDRSVYENRELSWLAFNERVLGEADNTNVPLLERLKFAAIFSSNLDEFFMVRTGTLIDRRLCDDGMLDPRTRLRPSEQLRRVYEQAGRLCERRDIFVSRIENALAAEGITRRGYAELGAERSEFADNYYLAEVKPHLTVITSGGDSLPPFIAGKRICAALRLADGTAAFVCPDGDGAFGRIVRLPAEGSFEYLLAEELIAAHAAEMVGQPVTECVTMRLVRSADISLDDAPTEGLPLTDAMKQTINLRDALPAVRMQLGGRVSELFRAELCSLFSLNDEQVYTERSPLDMGYAFALADMLTDRKSLLYPPYTPAPAPKGSMIDKALREDMLFSYPYESFDSFLDLLGEAAESPEVTSVKMTLYRTAKDSRVIDLLCRAAENGREVTVCVELRARFDERHNIACAEKLTAAGCRVIHGMRGYKVHSKLCLITLLREGELVRITQVGTGNYNENTARQYTDLSLITSDTDIGSDAERVFGALERGRLPEGMTSLMVSPNFLRSRIEALIDEEIRAAESGAYAYFGAKLNGLSDVGLINKLTEASKRGVRIELIVRGICCLRPGIAGLTDNIRVMSVVGRFLEHSRIYIFGSGRRQRVYISSADLMTRNTRRRVEAAAPITDPKLRERIVRGFMTELSDTAGAFVKHSDGTYTRALPADGVKVSCQKRFMEEYSPAKEESAPLPAFTLEKPPVPEAPDLPTAEAQSSDEPQTAAELPPAPLTEAPKKLGFFARIARFFRRSRR